MRKYDIIKVQGHVISVEDDYICLTDMAKAGNEESRAADLIKNWIQTKSTIEFLGAWETINNPFFKVVQFHHLRKNNNYTLLSVSKWVSETYAAGIYSKLGKHGGTYAHKDIAFEFGTAISPMFKLFVIKEFQRLKDLEKNSENLDWNIRRVMAKAQYHVQTDAVKNHKIPNEHIPQKRHFVAYAEEGDILNVALFGFTAKQWREKNTDLASKGHNVREYASVNELHVLASLEGINAEMIKDKIPFKARLQRLHKVATEQLAILNRKSEQNMLRKDRDGKPVIGLPYGKTFPAA